LKKTVVRIPGPSWMAYFLMSNTHPEMAFSPPVRDVIGCLYTGTSFVSATFACPTLVVIVAHPQNTEIEAKTQDMTFTRSPPGITLCWGRTDRPVITAEI